MALRPKLNRVWTSNNSIARRDPGDAKYLQGWVAEIPTYQVLNYLQYKVDTTMLAQAERGIFEWGNDVSYGVGSLAWDETNKTIYVCTVTNPSKTLAPSANPSQWSPSSIQVSRANYDSIVSAINNHIANLSNPHQVTAAQVGTYNRAEMDALVANYQAMVQAHVTDYNNPHKLTAVQVGAVPVEGGTYTGEVTMPTAYFNESKTAQLLQDNGLWLKNGSYLLGINGTTGNPETGTAASKSRLVTELNFPDVKLAQEPGYAHLDPSYEMQLVKSINISRGTGVFNSYADEPTYNDSLGGVWYSSNTNVARTWTNETALPDSGEYTICVDLQKISQIGSDNNWQFGLGFESFKIIMEYSGAVFVRYRDQAGVSANVVRVANALATTGKWYRVCAKVNSSSIQLFVDGVLAATYNTTSFGITDRRPVFSFWTLPAAITSATFAARSLRIWNTALTAKQVSTL